MPSALRVLRGQDSAPATRSPKSVPQSATELPAQSMDKSAADPQVEAAHKLFQALANIARSAENVGDRFPEEARRMHYEEIPARTIRGQATQDETRELLEEGILVLPAPVPAENDTH